MSGAHDSPGSAPTFAVPPIAVVVSRYNRPITDALLAGALAEHERRGGVADELAVISAPGSFELAALAGAAVRTGRYAGVCCLGCVIKGETPHDGHIARAIANALATLGATTGVPVAFGVLTCETEQQARDRAGGTLGNKCAEAMAALIEAVAGVRSLVEVRGPGLVHDLIEPAAGKVPG